MNYKWFISTAGIGSRLKELTQHTNKALIKINGRAVISYIIDKIPVSVPIVIALGFDAKQVKSFLTENYPDRYFTFVDIDNYDGPGSGLGYTMSKCEQYLQCPFIFCSNDTIVEEEVPLPDHNWMGYGQEMDVTQFRSLRLEGNRITEFCEKGATGTVRPYIGLSGIFDYRPFWDVLHDHNSGGHESFMKIGESAGLRKLFLDGAMIEPVSFTWWDTGNIEALSRARQELSERK